MLWSRQVLEWTDDHERTLRSLEVSEHGPGTILRDFEALLSFVRARELSVSKTYQLLPIKVLPEINARLAQPVELGLKRPNLKSYPHIMGLYLLLRASGLGRIDGTPSRPVLFIDPAVYDSWTSLNPTERYFTLLETWLLRGQPEIVGERASGFHFIGSYFWECAILLQIAEGVGLDIGDDDRAEWYYRYRPGLYGVALLELFGFLSIVHGPPQEGEGWQMEHVTSTPPGTALFALLGKELFSDFDKMLELEETALESFGALRPVVQPYFPVWQNNLSLPAHAFRAGVYVFKVSLGRDLWRRIAIPGALPLEDLAETIIGAFQFTYDHLYQFSYRNRFGVETHANHLYMDDGPWASEVRVGDIPLQEGQSMTYLYDFGDRWEFDVTLERVDPPDRAMKEPAILDARGEAPEQYPSWEE
jgi:hypothetical protein